VPLRIAAKFALSRAMRERGLSNVDVAQRLGVTETVVRRMLDPDHTTSPEKLQAALARLGKRLVVGLEDAA
jgi:antitoxin HicB